MSERQNNVFTPERKLKVKVKAIASQCINGSCKSNCNVSLKSHNALSGNDKDLVNILVNLW